MKVVLFVCNHNAGRSQMAQAFFEAMAPGDVRAESAGSAPAPAIWPEVVEAMREAGHDLSQRRPAKLSLLPHLDERFAGSRSPEEIRGCADAVLARFDDVPVRSHVLALAHRQACDCLRRGTCDVLAVG